jgi:hypothetical protein
MPVQAADIGKTTMDIGDAASTGCEQTAMESDERVSKKAAPASEASLSNQIHMVKNACERKPWKSGWAPHICPLETDR